VLLACVLLVAGAPGPSLCAGPAHDLAASVAAGCRVREASAEGFEFRATVEEFTGRGRLELLFEQQDRADQVDRFMGTSDGSRGRFAEYHRVTEEEWEFHARCLWWGGCGSRFSADADREPDQVGDLYVKRLCRPDVALEFHSGPLPSRAMGSIEAPDYRWANDRSPPAAYLGLRFDGPGPLSELVDDLLREGAAVTAETVTHEGREGVVLGLKLVVPGGAYQVLRLGFIRLDGYAPFLAERLGVVSPEPGVELLTRTVATWGDYARVPEGPWIPCAYDRARFSTDGAGVLRLEGAVRARVQKTTIAATSGRLPDDDLRRWFPVGTYVRVLSPAAELLGAGVVEAMTQDNDAASGSEEWVTCPVETLVPWMDDPLFTAALEERKRLADQLREETKRMAQEGN